MPLSITFEELLRYTNGERDKWRGWFLEHAEAIEAPVQAGGRLPTAGKTGQEFEREYLGTRLHHHAETQNIVNTCIQKSQRLELVDSARR